MSHGDNGVGDGCANVGSHDYVNGLSGGQDIGSHQRHDNGGGRGRGLEKDGCQDANHDSSHRIGVLAQQISRCATPNDLGRRTEQFQSHQEEIQKKQEKQQRNANGGPFLGSVATTRLQDVFPRRIGHLLVILHSLLLLVVVVLLVIVVVVTNIKLLVNRRVLWWWLLHAVDLGNFSVDGAVGMGGHGTGFVRCRVLGLLLLLLICAEITVELCGRILVLCSTETVGLSRLLINLWWWLFDGVGISLLLSLLLLLNNNNWWLLLLLLRWLRMIWWLLFLTTSGLSVDNIWIQMFRRTTIVVGIVRTLNNK